MKLRKMIDKILGSKKANSEKQENGLFENNFIVNDKKLLIVFDYSKLPKNGYCYKYEDEESFKELRECRIKNSRWACLDDILEEIDISKRNYARIKYCDPNIMEILYNKKGIKGVNCYFNELEKGKFANKDALPYKMTYNLKSILENKNLSLKQKLNIIGMIEKNKYLSDIQYDSKFGKRISSFFLALLLSFVAIPEMLPFQVRDGEFNRNFNNNTITDTIDRTKNNIKEHTDKIEEYVIEEDDIKKTDEENKESIVKHELDEIKKIAEEFKNVHNNLHKNEDRKIELGSIMQLPEGMVFMESVSGGRIGQIGDVSSPKDGVYVIDYSAEVSEGGVTGEYGLEGKIEGKISNSKQYVHVSLIYGAKNIKEAQEIINEQKENSKINVVDSNIIQPRGWISIDTVQKIFNEQNQQNQHTQQSKDDLQR